MLSRARGGLCPPELMVRWWYYLPRPPPVFIWCLPLLPYLITVTEPGKGVGPF